MFFDINAQYFFNTQPGVLKNIQYPKDKQLLPKYIMTIPVMYEICFEIVSNIAIAGGKISNAYFKSKINDVIYMH